MNMFQAIVHKCLIGFASMHNVMVKTPLKGMACYDRERDFCMHPNFGYVLVLYDMPNMRLGVLVP